MGSTTTVTKELLQPQHGGGGPSSSSSTMAEDESLKRNTDCVYFLASPLTCKKGSECEYRHSEYARVNPRDCYYWLNSNCLNPKCSFRHPPLDGLITPQAGNFAGPSVLVQPGPSVPTVPQNPTKQGVLCIFFQKGYCLKGDRCPFMHGPNPPTMKIQQASASVTVPEASVFNKAFSTLEKCTQPKTNLQVNLSKVKEAPLQERAIPKVQPTRSLNGASAGRGYQPPSGMIQEVRKYGETKPPSVGNGNLRTRTGPAHHSSSYDDQNIQNGREADDSLRESSPGFDVLVDDKLNEDEYYHEDQYVRMRGNDGRNLKEFDMGFKDDYNSVADMDPEIYHSRRGYDSFDRFPEKYAQEHRRASSERALGEPPHYDRRGSYKSQSPDFNQKSDLRNRLSKQRRVNGLKSVVNSDYSLDDHVEDRGHRSIQKDSHQSVGHEISRGRRLQGRIKLPRRCSPMSGNDVYSERGRLSPSRQQASSQQGRLRDRLRGRIQDESREGRRINGPMVIKDTSGADFAGPKRLSELKGSRQSDSDQQLIKSHQSGSGGKLRDRVLASSVGIEDHTSFEGPKPLSEILKRKRTATTGTTSDNNKEEIKHSDNDVNITDYALNSDTKTGKHVTLSSASEKDKAGEIDNKPLVVKAAEEEGEISNKKIKLNGDRHAELSLHESENKHSETKEDLIVADNENQEYNEEYEAEDGAFDYEQYDGEGGTGDHEADSMDEDDGDDFAKQLGVSF
ncbi:zinc finger CCCH domain-containing protein 17-like [Amaranthus tricolor]|uniref:zinc finger CCCH domain-containing protein 17-like n=1 Tax=Amaranthus tricolor TaxID=29722 RepID=UPI00258E5949|nr:zinc finger CCCH domain-containing protein 17-like [Amaranthus tricolor]